MTQIRMFIRLFVAYLALCCTGIRVKANRENKGYCDKDDVESLENRVSRADVVITGTIIGLTEEIHVSDDTDSTESSNGRHSRALTVGIVKLWRVVKGSLEHVHNQSIDDQGESSVMKEMGLEVHNNAENEIIQQPTIKVYGIGNHLLCGSFVTTGDTRIFFLQKFRDVRDVSSQRSAAIGDMISPAEESSLDNKVGKSARLSKNPSKVKKPNGAAGGTDKKKKTKKGKGKKKKRKKGKKGKSGKKTRKAKDRGITMKRLPKSKKKKPKQKRASETSVIQGASGGQRPKRSSGIPFQVLRMSPEHETSSRKVRTAADRAVLVLNASPARITLDNLNSVEKLAKNL